MPFTGYDAGSIMDYYDRRPLEVGWRLNSLGFPLLGWYLGLLWDKALGLDQKVAVQKRRGSQLRRHIVQSKSVALIKSGQALSLRPDIIRNPYWAEELAKLVDAVGSFPDEQAMKIMRQELSDLLPRLQVSQSSWQPQAKKRAQAILSSSNKKNKTTTTTTTNPRLQRLVETDPILSLFEFFNDYQCVASASIGQVYKARIRAGPQLVAAIGESQAARWGDRTVAIKIQRPDVEASASLDMYLLRRMALWLDKFRGGDLPRIADAFGMQLYGELDYIREANNCERFRSLYDGSGGSEIWARNVCVPAACDALTRRRVLVMDWIDGQKAPWNGRDGLHMVGIGLRCSVDQLMNTGLFHADPHRGNLLMTPDDRLAIIDFGMVVDVDEDFRYSLFGLVIGLQTKDLTLVTENLLKLGFLKDSTQMDILVPRLREAFRRATGGTDKASNVNFAQMQAELDAISRENLVQFSSPPNFTVIMRSLTILEGVALSVDKHFRLVRGAYPYVLRQLLSPDDYGRPPPAALQNLLVRLLTVNGEGREIEWERLRDLLRLAEKATQDYNPSSDVLEKGDGDAASSSNRSLSRRTVELFARFLTSRTGVFLKKPLVHELAEVVDGMASIGEGTLLRWSRGLFPILPGMNGPVNVRRMDELRLLLETLRSAITEQTTTATTRSGRGGGSSGPAMGAAAMARMQAMMDLLRGMIDFLSDARLREESGPLIEEVQSVAQMVAVEVLEIRGSRAMRTLLRV